MRSAEPERSEPRSRRRSWLYRAWTRLTRWLRDAHDDDDDEHPIDRHPRLRKPAPNRRIEFEGLENREIPAAPALWSIGLVSFGALF